MALAVSRSFSRFLNNPLQIVAIKPPQWTKDSLCVSIILRQSIIKKIHSRNIYSSSHCCRRTLHLHPTSFVLRNTPPTPEKCLSHKFFSSSQKEVSSSFSDEDSCLVFNENNSLINFLTTVEEAKIFAFKRRQKLTYINKNADGAHCFKLEKHTKKSAIEAEKEKKENPRPVIKKREKNLAKEFKFKSKSDDHDILIKVKRIQKYLEKGKQIIIFYNPGRKDTVSKIYILLNKYICLFLQHYNRYKKAQG